MRSFPRARCALTLSHSPQSYDTRCVTRAGEEAEPRQRPPGRLQAQSAAEPAGRGRVAAGGGGRGLGYVLRNARGCGRAAASRVTAALSFCGGAAGDARVWLHSACGTCAAEAAEAADGLRVRRARWLPGARCSARSVEVAALHTLCRDFALHEIERVPTIPSTEGIH